MKKILLFLLILLGIFKNVFADNTLIKDNFYFFGKYQSLNYDNPGDFSNGGYYIFRSGIKDINGDSVVSQRLYNDNSIVFDTISGYIQTSFKESTFDDKDRCYNRYYIFDDFYTDHKVFLKKESTTDNGFCGFNVSDSIFVYDNKVIKRFNDGKYYYYDFVKKPESIKTETGSIKEWTGLIPDHFLPHISSITLTHYKVINNLAYIFDHGDRKLKVYGFFEDGDHLTRLVKQASFDFNGKDASVKKTDYFAYKDSTFIVVVHNNDNDVIVNICGNDENGVLLCKYTDVFGDKVPVFYNTLSGKGYKIDISDYILYNGTRHNKFVSGILGQKNIDSSNYKTFVIDNQLLTTSDTGLIIYGDGNTTNNDSSSGSTSTGSIEIISNVDLVGLNQENNNFIGTGFIDNIFSKYLKSLSGTLDNLGNKIKLDGFSDKIKGPAIVISDKTKELLKNNNNTCEMFNSDGSFKVYGTSDYHFTFNILQGNFLDYVLIIPQNILDFITNPLNNTLSLFSIFRSFDDGQEICYLGTVQKVEYQKIFKEINKGNSIIGNGINIEIGTFTIIDYYILIIFGLIFFFGILSILSKL